LGIDDELLTIAKFPHLALCVLLSLRERIEVRVFN
jgi:hypothetical protein